MQFDTTSPWGTWKPRGTAALCLGIIDSLPPGGLFRRLAFLLRKPVKNSPQDVHDRDIWGLKLRLATRGNLTEQRWLTMPAFHDIREREAMAAALHPGAVFVDIGANAGFYTFWALAQRHPNLRVIAVKPTKVMLERIRYNLAANNLSSAVTLCACAVTPTPGEVWIEENAVNVGESSIGEKGTGYRVPGTPLLDILQSADVRRVDVMKIDIEGFEVPVLDAFFQTVPRTLWPRVIIGEIVGTGGKPLQDLLAAKGYLVKSCTKMNGILVLPDAPAESP
jgi:FkbM family methyltransferase